MSSVMASAKLDKVFNRLKQLESTWHQNQSPVWGMETPFRALNRLTGGLHPGLTVWGARTSHGKSAACMQIVFHVVQELAREWASGDPSADPPPGQVLVFSPEMTPLQLMERYATQRSRVSLTRIREGTASEVERQDWLDAADEMVAFQRILHLYAGEAQDEASIQNEIERAYVEGPPVKLVLIDYLQRVRSSGIAGRTGDVVTLSGIMDRLQSAAAEFEIPVLVASQLNRAIERDNQTGRVSERPPELSDLKGSGSIEEDADCVILLWRPPEAAKPTASGKPSAQTATLYVKKNRHGPVGEVEMRYYPDLLSFADLDRSR